MKTAISKTNNGVELTTTPCTIIRGAAKGQVYLAFVPTKENLSAWIQFTGEEKVIDILARAAKANGQAALDYTIGDAGWVKSSVTDPETGKTVEVESYDPDSVNWEQVLETIVSGAVQGGVTMKELKEERDDLYSQMQKIMLLAGDANVPQNEKQEAFANGFALAIKIQDLDSAIEAKKKTRRSDNKE